LLGLVYGAVVTLAVITAVALVVVVDARLSDATMTSTVNADRELVRAFIATQLNPRDLDAPVGEPREAELAAALAGLISSEGLRAVRIYDLTGSPIVANPGAGQAPTGSAAESQLAAALVGSVQSNVVKVGSGQVLREYLPVLVDGEVRAVAFLERDASAMLARADDARRDVLLVVSTGTFLLGGLLFLIFRAAHERLARQSRELVEATRRDPLTGLPNHGAAVASVTEALAAAANEGGWLVAALIDVDNFGLFDTTHGHAAARRHPLGRSSAATAQTSS
jgi:predicted signal transduction protein with EAL and GGDEF domain